MRERVIIGVVALLATTAPSCGGSQASDPEPIPTEFIAGFRDRAHCIRSDETPIPSFTYPGTTPVPYPSPSGERVPPEFDVPTFPGAVEIDGFVRDGFTTQMFEAETTEEELFAFFEEALLNRGMLVTGATSGGAGRSCIFGPWNWLGDSRARPMVIVSTEWVHREGEPQSPPPGYQGPGARFAPPSPGTLWFFVTTDR